MRLAILSVALLVLASCVEKKSGPKIDPAYVEANLLAEAPATLTNQVDADLGGKVVYLGNEIDTEVLTPGGAAKVGGTGTRQTFETSWLVRSLNHGTSPGPSGAPAVS